MSRPTAIRGSLNPVRPATAGTRDSKGAGMCLRIHDLGFCPSERAVETVPMLNPSLNPSLKVPLKPALRADPATVAVRAHRGRSETASVAAWDVSAGQRT